MRSPKDWLRILRAPLPVRETLRRLFGEFAWTPPPWLAAVREKLSHVRGPAIPAVSRSVLYTWLVAFAATAAAVVIFMTKTPPPPPPSPNAVEPPTALWEKHPNEKPPRPDTLLVAFKKSVAPMSNIGKPAVGVVTLQPPMPGKWVWRTDRVLAFEPAQSWPIGTDYVITCTEKGLAPHLVFPVKPEARISTAPFLLATSEMRFYQHPENPQDKRLVATYTFSHPVDARLLREKLTLRLFAGTSDSATGGTELKFDLTIDSEGTKAFLNSQNLAIPRNDALAVAVLDIGVKAAAGSNELGRTELRATVPGMYSYFRVESASASYVENDRNEVDQVLMVQTNTEVLETEMDRNVTALLLPALLKEGQPDEKLHIWQNNEITPEVLKRSTAVPLTRVQGDRDAATTHTFKLRAPEGRHLFVRVREGTRAFHGYVLAGEYRAVVPVSYLPKALRILGNGAILPLGREKKLAVMARGIGSFDVEIHHVLPGQLAHLVTQTYGAFARPGFRNSYSLNWDNISERDVRTIPLTMEDPRKPVYTTIDMGEYLARAGGSRGFFHLRLRSNETGVDSRFILLTDLGMIEKRFADGSHDIFVQSMGTGQPLGGVTVEVMGTNGLTVATANTDGEGRAHFAPLHALQREQAPVAFVARQGQDVSFLPILGSGDRALNYSRFDVGGVRTQGRSGVLEAYAFTDRGIYRPGESYHVAAIVRALDWTAVSPELPLVWTVQDPRGATVNETFTRPGPTGLVELGGETQLTSLTGTYTASLHLIDKNKVRVLLGAVTFRVEEFVADRMKVHAGFETPSESVWVPTKGLRAWVRVMNLFGRPAADRRVVSRLDIRPGMPHFRQWREYQFHSNLKDSRTFTEDLGETTTDDKGEVYFDLDLDKYAKGTYRILLAVDAFEADGGRSVSAETSVLVSPQPFFIGFKADGNLNYLREKARQQVHFIAVNPSGQRTAAKGLSLRILERVPVSVLVQKEDKTFEWERSVREVERSRKPFQLGSNGYTLALPSDNGGEFIASVEDGQGNQLCAVPFRIIGSGRGRDFQSELLLTLAAEDLDPGQELEVQIESPYVGAGLITIERERVYAAKWFKTSDTRFVQRIAIPPDLEGTAYLNVTMLRDVNSREIFQSPLSYAVRPFSVSARRRTIAIDLTAPEEVKPGSEVSLQYKGDKAGQAVLYAVDEGILQVAGYTTPNPLERFQRKRALEVETNQLLDLLLPDHRMLREVSAPGGDEGADLVARNLNPFHRKSKPPAVFWSAVVPLDGTVRSQTFRVPEYFNGNLKVFAVASSGDAVGTAEAQTFVRGDLILTPVLPLTMTPGDEGVVSVSVFNNMKGKSGEAPVTVKLTPSPHLQIVGKDSALINVTHNGEASARFTVKANDMLGEAKLVLTASSGSARASLNESLSLRPAVPFRTRLWAGRIDDEAKKVEVVRDVYPHYATHRISVSALPLGLAGGLAGYLEEYPYGCTEQLISKAVPTLILSRYPEFGFSREKAQKAFVNATALLRQRETSQGGYGLWSAFDEPEKDVSLYAIHYLIEARRLGYVLPGDTFASPLEFLASQFNAVSPDLPSARRAAYAGYLLARLGTPGVGERATALLAEARALSHLKEAWNRDVGSLFLAATFKQLQQDGVAEQIVKAHAMPDPKVAVNGTLFSGEVQHGLTLYLLSTHFPQAAQQHAPVIVEVIERMIQGGTYHSLSSAMAILGLEAFAALDARAGNPVKITEALTAQKTQEVRLRSGIVQVGDFSPGAKSLLLRAPERKGYYLAQISGYDRAPVDKAIAEKVEVRREYRKPGAAEALTAVTLGDEIEARIQIRSTSGSDISNLAVVDLFPACFELVLERGGGSSASLMPVPRGKPVWREIERLFERLPFPEIFASKAFAQEEGEESYEGEETVEGEESGDGGEESYEEGGEEPTEGSENVAEDAGTTGGSVTAFLQSQSNFDVAYAEPREDRVVVYGMANTEVRDIVYRLRATCEGKFRVPPVLAEGMYDRSVQGLSSGGALSVEPVP